MKITVALFDLDDTLFRHRQAVRDGIAAHLAAHLPDVDAAGHQDRWDELEERHYHRYLSGELDYLGQRRARARDFMLPFGVEYPTDAAAEAWFTRYLRQYRRAWQLHDDALPCLDVLAKRGIRLGLITNGELQFQVAKLDAMALASRLEHVVASGEFGVTKPDPRIFRHACEQFGVVPSAAVYVGDRLQTDAIGAANAGLTGVWLDRGGAATAADDAAVAAAGVRVIRSLAQLTELVDSLGRAED